MTMMARELTPNPRTVRLPEDDRARLNVDPRGAALAWRALMGDRRRLEAQAEAEAATRSRVLAAVGRLRDALQAAGQPAAAARLERLAHEGRTDELLGELDAIRGYDDMVADVRAVLADAAPDTETTAGMFAEARRARPSRVGLRNSWV